MYARLVVEPAIVAFGAAAAPLVETWCDKESPLRTVGDVMGRKVYRFAAEDDLSNSATIQKALQTTRCNPGSHLHGSLPCTPLTSWQRLNLHRGSQATKARTARIREQSLEWLKTFTRLGKATLTGGGSVSFERPRFCNGWRQEGVRSMISELKLIPVSVDGCAAGVVDEDGTPIFKPWRIMVSDVHLAAATGGFKCNGDHLHRRCEGSQKVAQTAYYPRRLCEALHESLDAHEAARELCSPCLSARPAVGAAASPSRRVSESSCDASLNLLVRPRACSSAGTSSLYSAPPFVTLRLSFRLRARFTNRVSIIRRTGLVVGLCSIAPHISQPRHPRMDRGRVIRRTSWSLAAPRHGCSC